MAVEFIDNSIKVKAALNDSAIKFLYEAGQMLQRQAADNTRVGSGETAGAWTYVVDEDKGVCTVGNPLQNSLWEELGTGEFALHGDGRRGGWSYQDDSGEWHHTYGKTPTRALHNAFVTKETAIIRGAESIMKEGMK